MAFNKQLYLEDVIRLGRVKFTELVRDELSMARLNFPTGMRSAHEGFAIIKEEVDELWDEVKVNQKCRDPAKLLSELVQVAAMAQRMAEDIVFAGKLGE